MLVAPSLVVFVALTLTALAPSPDFGTWTGEVVDMACYVSTGAVGDANRACHMEVHRTLPTDLGQPTGLLTDDGTLLLLSASPMTPEAFSDLRDAIGHKATVDGRYWDRNGMAVVGVEGVRR